MVGWHVCHDYFSIGVTGTSIALHIGVKDGILGKAEVVQPTITTDDEIRFGRSFTRELVLDTLDNFLQFEIFGDEIRVHDKVRGSKSCTVDACCKGDADIECLTFGESLADSGLKQKKNK